MNRAAFAARSFLVIVLLPAVAAAAYTEYAYRHQPLSKPVAATRRVRPVKLQIRPPGLPTRVIHGFVLGTYAGAGISGLAAFDQAVGSPAALSEHYVRWGGTFPAKYVAAAAKLGAQTVLELLPSGRQAPTIGQIAFGQQDAWLASFGAALSSLGDHVLLSFAPEMNGGWYSYGSGHATAAGYIAAFRHIHDVLSRSTAGALISWVWQPSAIQIRTPSPVRYWPGAGFVDYIALDGYYYYFASDTFDVIFGETLRELHAIAPKPPVLIGETAVGPLTAHQRAGVTNLIRGIVSNHLLGLVWFNQDQSSSKSQYHQDWRLQDHQAVLRTFRALIQAQVRTASLPISQDQSTPQEGEADAHRTDPRGPSDRGRFHGDRGRSRSLRPRLDSAPRAEPDRSPGAGQPGHVRRADRGGVPGPRPQSGSQSRPGRAWRLCRGYRRRPGGF